MGYVSFLAPKPPAPEVEPIAAAIEPASPVASTSTLASSAESEAKATAAAADAASAGPSRSNGKRPRVVSYLSDDEPEVSRDADDDGEEMGAAVMRRPPTKVARTTTAAVDGDRHSNGKGKAREGNSSSFTVDKARLRAEKDRLKATRMELPIWAGSFFPNGPQLGLRSTSS